MSKWPDVVTEDMWPFAVRHIVNFHNASVRRDKASTPFQLFTGQEAPWSLNDFRVFGCPTYVLHKQLQDGNNFSKWKARCWQGVHVGPSMCHASNVPLIYNPATTHITPKFHVAYDEGFTSITTLSNDTKEKILQKLYEKAQWTYTSPLHDPSEMYHFDSFWMDPPLAVRPEGRGRKQNRSLLPKISAPGSTLPPEGASSSTSTGSKQTPALISAPGAISNPEGVSNITPSFAPGMVSPPEGAPITPYFSEYPNSTSLKAPRETPSSEGASNVAPALNSQFEDAPEILPAVIQPQNKEHNFEYTLQDCQNH